MKIAASMCLGLAGAIIVQVYGPGASFVMGLATATGVYCFLATLSPRRWW